MSLSSICSVNNCKRASACLCLHCDQKVCSKHFNDHQTEVNNELIPLVDRVNQLRSTLKPEDDRNLPLNLLKQWRDEKQREIDREYERKVKELNREIFKQESELSKIVEKINELLKDGEASFEQIKQFKQDIRIRENEINKLMLNDQTNQIDNESNFENRTVQLGTQKVTIKGKVLCDNVLLYAMESDKSFTGYNGLCPICRKAHISLVTNRGFYVPCEQIDKKIREQTKKTRQ